MSSRNSSVYVHQSSSSRSSSSSGRSTAPSPRTGTTYREYGAVNHTTRVVQSGSNTIVQHNKRHYDPSSPSPSYRA
ncbi:hypothetical protein GGI43DRAFT_387226 [Trichoderma evansii]